MCISGISCADYSAANASALKQLQYVLGGFS
jgi:hypothetical protein